MLYGFLSRAHTQPQLVDLDAAVDDVGEPEAAHEADGAGDEEDAEGDESHVPEVQQVRYEEVGRLEEVEPHARVREDVDGGGAAGEERAPVPAVVLGTELEVAEEDGELTASDGEDDAH